jgi:hypothetical protein
MDEAVSDAALEPFLPDWIDAAAEQARSVALARRNLLWEPMQLHLRKHSVFRHIRHGLHPRLAGLG